MSEIYSYRLLNNTDILKLENLFKSAFNLNVKENFFNWKYFSNPCGETILVGAFYNDQLVGSGAMLIENMNVLGTNEKVYKCTDLMTHPEHQKKGISKEINKLLNEEVIKNDSLFSYTLCSKISTKSFIKNNWSHLGEISNLFKPHLLLKLTSFSKKNKHIKQISFTDNILINYNFIFSDLTISLNKTNDYLKWRCSNPNFSYTILGHFDDDNNLNGYLIYSLSNNNLINVIDIDSNSKNDKLVKRNLLSEVERLSVYNKNKGLLFMTLKNSELNNFLRRKGYIYNPFKKGPLVSILDLNLKINKVSNQKLDASNIWDISSLNYDDI